MGDAHYRLMLLHYLQGCFFDRKNNRSVERYFRRKQVSCRIGYYKAHDRWIRYVETGDCSRPLLLFVHGAPGSLNAFLHFLSDSRLQQQAHMIAVDRPGFGYSGFGKAVVSVQRQAAMLAPLLHKNSSGRPAILAGHSYGGTIVARMAMDYPDEVGALLLAAPAVDPRLEKIFAVSYPADLPPLKWLVPVCMRVANSEKLGHRAQLYRMLPLWRRIKVPVTVIHGSKDWIAPVENVLFLERQLTQSRLKTIVPQGMSHLVPWENPGLMKQALEACL